MPHGVYRHHQQKEPNMRRFFAWSFGLHVVALIIATVSLSHTVKMPAQTALQVKLVGVPQPKPASSKPVEPQEVRTQDSPAPKEPPPDVKNMPKTEAQSKFATDETKDKAETDKQQLVKADERPPVLDKNPKEKKVVKNKPDAKVVKDPEDFLKSLDFIDKLDNSTPSPTTTAKASKQPAGEGPKINLNMSEQGTVDGIRKAIQDNWIFPGSDTDDLVVSVEVEVDEGGNVTASRISSGSGNNAFDQSLLRAVRKASPLPIPDGQYETFKVMDLQFDGSGQ